MALENSPGSISRFKGLVDMENIPNEQTKEVKPQRTDHQLGRSAQVASVIRLCQCGGTSHTVTATLGSNRAVACVPPEEFAC